MPHLTSRAAVGQDAASAHVLVAAEDRAASARSFKLMLALSARKLQSSMSRGGAERVTQMPDASSRKLFGWRQSLCRAKGGTAAALLLHESGE